MAVAELTELMTEDDLVKLTGLQRQTLQNWRCQHKGPPFIKLGRSVRYERRAVVDWLRENTVIPRN